MRHRIVICVDHIVRHRLFLRWLLKGHLSAHGSGAARNQISFRVGRKKAIRVDFWGGTVGLALIGHMSEPDPNPFDLPGKVEKRGWSWQIARVEQVPPDLSPVIEFVEKRLANG